MGFRIDEQIMKIKTIRKKQKPLTEADLQAGDHIRVKRKRRFYTHHGIYMGDGEVVHVSGSIREKTDPVVMKTHLQRFLKGGTLKRREYKERLPAAETIRIAERHISDKSYSMIWNNCEHFATYCAIGKKKSRQVKGTLSGLGTVATGVVVYVLTRIVKSAVRKP